MSWRSQTLKERSLNSKEFSAAFPNLTMEGGARRGFSFGCEGNRRFDGGPSRVRRFAAELRSPLTGRRAGWGTATKRWGRVKWQENSGCHVSRGPRRPGLAPASSRAPCQRLRAAGGQ